MALVPWFVCLCFVAWLSLLFEPFGPVLGRLWLRLRWHWRHPGSRLDISAVSRRVHRQLSSVVGPLDVDQSTGLTLPLDLADHLETRPLEEDSSPLSHLGVRGISNFVLSRTANLRA